MVPEPQPRLSEQLDRTLINLPEVKSTLSLGIDEGQRQ